MHHAITAYTLDQASGDLFFFPTGFAWIRVPVKRKGKSK
jgi:hypothetical protein